MTMPPPYQPYTPSYPSMNPTASSFNYQPPAQDLQSILGGLKGTGSTFGLPWQPGYTAQPGITTPMVPQPGVPTTGPVGPLNPAGVNPRPYGPAPVAPQPPVVPPAGGGGGIQDLQNQSSLLFHNNFRSKLGLPPLTPGTPQYQQWLMNQQRNGGMPAWMPPERAGSGMGGGMGGAGRASSGGSFAGGSHGGDIGAGTHGGHPTY